MRAKRLSVMAGIREEPLSGQQGRVTVPPNMDVEPKVKLYDQGAYVSKRLNLGWYRKGLGEMPCRQPYLGNPAVRNEREAWGNVDRLELIP